MEECKRIPFPLPSIPDERVWPRIFDPQPFTKPNTTTIAMTRSIYLSYHPESQKFAGEIAKHLESSGLHVFIDFKFRKEREEMGDRQWREQSLGKATKILALCSPKYKAVCDESTGKKLTQQETTVKLEYEYIRNDIIANNFINKKMLTVYHSAKTKKSSIPQMFINYPPYQWSNAREREDLDYALWDVKKYEPPRVIKRGPPKTIKEDFSRKNK